MSFSRDNQPDPALNRALVLAAHGERNVVNPNTVLAGHAHALQTRLPDTTVTYGVLNGAPAFEEALAEAARSGSGRILVYPFFMAAGYFTASALPERISNAGLGIPADILEPLGEARGLPDIMMREAIEASGKAGFVPAQARLLVVGHGSRSDAASAEATARIASTLRAMETFSAVEIALLEEPPSITDQLESAVTPVVASGFFAGDGMHAARDVPEALSKSSVPSVYAGPVGASAEIREIIARAVEKRFAGGDSDADLHTGKSHG